jgi:hypothetical protein
METEQKVAAFVEKVVGMYWQTPHPIRSIAHAQKALAAGADLEGVLHATWQAGMNEMCDILAHHLEYFGGGCCIECGEEREADQVYCPTCVDGGGTE